jgi:hypothetical protein
MPTAIVFQTVQTIKHAPTGHPPSPAQSAGAELLVYPDDKQFRRIAFGLMPGETMGLEWSDDWLVPFEDKVELILKQDNDFGATMYTLGSVTVTSAAVNDGAQKHSFTEEGAHVVLTYLVKEVPDS